MTKIDFRALLLAAGACSFLIAPSAGQTSTEKEARAMLQQLVETPGVSFHEGKVLDRIREMLPLGVPSAVDDMNNLVVTIGPGKPEIMFVAHMDEIGLEVTEITSDGRLKTRTRGGSFSTVWEGKVVKIYTGRGVADGVVEPRKSYRDPSPQPHSAEDLVVYVGAGSKAAAEERGFRPGDFITAPKRMTPLGPYKLAAPSTDDRAGCTAQLLALRRLAGRRLARTVAFAWVVQEETGLSGSRHLSKTYAPRYVFAVDTFVSSDAPFDPQNIGYAPQGRGAVLRVFDSSNITPADTYMKVRRLAETRKIPVQWSITSGGNDGSVFLQEGSIDMPLSWPGIYSHSNISVVDVRDLLALTDLIGAIADAF